MQNQITNIVTFIQIKIFFVSTGLLPNWPICLFFVSSAPLPCNGAVQYKMIRKSLLHTFLTQPIWKDKGQAL